MHLCIMPSFTKCTSLVKSHQARFLDLLFTLYINDIANCTSSARRLFADDTCLILQHKNLADLNVKINTEIKAIEKYMIANKLTLNTSKSNVIVINSKSKDNNITTDFIASKLSLVQNAKYSRVSFDTCLSFKNHITPLEKKLSRAVGILAEVKPFLNRKALLSLYYGIFHSNLHYGLNTWGSTYKSYLQELCVLQNKTLKILGGGKYYERACCMSLLV